MAQTSFALMTNLGRAKEAAALANATTIEITHIAIGDGVTVPSGGETALYNEVARKTISGHGTVVGASNVAYFDCYLAAGDGPYTIREAGLYDVEGDLIAIAHYNPPINKPVPESGQTVEGTVRLEVAFSNIATVIIAVDPSMMVALQRLTRLPWIPVISMSLATPPVSPVPGDTYLIAASPTGAWTGQAGKIAEYTIAGWAIITPPDGHGVSLPNGRVFERISGAYIEKIALDAQIGKWTYAVAGGTADVLTATLDPVPAAYAAGMAVRLKIATVNTGVATLNVNGLGAKSIRRADGLDLSSGDLKPHQVICLIYDGTVFRFAGSARSEMSQLVMSPMTAVKFTAIGSTSFEVPAGVTSILVRIWGAGGGEGYANGGTDRAPSGGASGGYAERRFIVSPGDDVAIVVGAGGIGGAANPAQQGQPGLNSTVTVNGVTVTANGGGGGLNATVANQVANAPAGGSHAGAEFGIRGEDGHIGVAVGVGATASGGSGAGAPYGGGMVGGGRGNPGVGMTPGGGGGATSDSGIAGAAGARGEVHIVYATPGV